jgi:hypothetical protein
MKQLTVLGGTGFVGSRVVRALRASAAVEVQVASRRGPRVVDVDRPETFSALEGTDLLVDVSDATGHPPDEVIDWCLRRGIAVLEATSDAACVERLHHRFHATPGRLVLGGGIFTGLSNLLGRQAAQRVSALESLTLGISSSPFSGAGASTIALMVAALATPVVRWERGQRVDAQLSRGPPLAFPSASRATVRAAFAEAFMLQHTTHAPALEVLFAPTPSILVPAFLAMPRWVARSRLGQAALRAYFTVLRRFFFRAVPTRVELVAHAVGATSASEQLVATDGMEAGALALAAMAEAVSLTSGSGVQFIDDVVALEPMVQRANAFAGRELIRLGAEPPRRADPHSVPEEVLR